jgi:hypothetical protein
MSLDAVRAPPSVDVELVGEACQMRAHTVLAPLVPTVIA